MATGLSQPRTISERSRDAEFFDAAELERQTGQPRARFGSLALKELLDNGGDAAETAEKAPCLTLTVDHPSAELVALTVQDNGDGMTPETVARILNFATRTSDKAAYKSPTRGAQGNALKTILGIPWALGCAEPLMITSQGVEHRIRAALDPSGDLLLTHTTRPVAPHAGTCVTLTVPHEALDRDPVYWGQAFALFNPHASVKICQGAEADLACSEPESTVEHFYQATAAFPKPWRKYLPGDPTSAWWYSVDDLTRRIFSHISESRRGGPDFLLRDFVRKYFTNLSANAAAKAVCAAVPTITRLSDFASQEAAVATLHAAMRREGKPPSPATLGTIGADHFRHCFAAWYGVKRFWYKASAGLYEGLPFTAEVAVAETLEEGEVWTGVNFSPTFEDPLSQVWLSSPKVHAHGLRNFLLETDALPRRAGWGWESETPAVHRAVALHLVCPALTFLDRGKTRLSLPAWQAAHVTTALWGTTQVLYKEAEARKKDAAKQARREAEQARATAAPQWSLKEAVYAVMQMAWAHATGNGAYRVSKRFLFYPVRKLIQQYTAKGLDYNYFSQDVLVEYQREHGALPGLYADPRGMLYEPHTGVELPLGTMAVETYQFPAWRYDKILYVEKKGLWPILQDAQLAERYDMAVVAGEGYATEAIRVLLQHANTEQQYQLFVLHDADPDGYNIARTLREETDRMPGYAVEVIDLGLHVEEALALGLDTEEFTRQKALPSELVLSEAARVAFTGRRLGPKSWIGQRVELNAFSAPALVTYIEQQLQRAGVRGKVIPSAKALPGLVTHAYRRELDTLARRALAALLQTETIVAQVVAHFADRLPLDDARTWIEEALTETPTLAWDRALAQKLASLAWPLWDEIEADVRTVLRRVVQEEFTEESEESEDDDAVC